MRAKCEALPVKTTRQCHLTEMAKTKVHTNPTGIYFCTESSHFLISNNDINQSRENKASQAF